MSNKMNERLRIMRENAGLTQEDIARRIGKSAAVISHYETGERTPSLHVFRKLAQLLDVSMDMLFAGDPLPLGHACPYCGSDVTDVERGPDGDWYSRCGLCSACGPSAPSRRMAMMMGRARGNCLDLCGASGECNEDVAT